MGVPEQFVLSKMSTQAFVVMQHPAGHVDDDNDNDDDKDEESMSRRRK